jgi:hypothetical protein
MLENCGLKSIKADAKVTVGQFSVGTPHIISINVTKTRGQLVNTAQVQFHVDQDNKIGTGTFILIEIQGSLVFTGIVKRIDVSPSFRCMGEKIIRIQAEDSLYKIVNRNITRRQKDPGLGIICFISSIYKRVTVGFDNVRNLQDVAHSSSDIEVFTPTTNFAEMNQFVKDGQTNVAGALHPVTKIADQFSNRGGLGGAGGITLHSHETLDLSERGGGPAKSVFGVK